MAVHPARTQTTDAAREYRKAYRQRPEVKEKMRAYRKRRAERLRAAKKFAVTEPSSIVVVERATEQ